MKQKHDETMSLGVLLAISAGLMDAYSFFFRGGVFANAQTGNILIFSVSVARGDWVKAVQYLCPITAFALGIFGAAVLRHFCESRRHLWVLLAEIAILFGTAFFPERLNLPANSLISLACGFQLESFRFIERNPIATTMCIGNLRSAVHAGVEAMFGGGREERHRCLLYLSVIGAFALGAVLGNVTVGLVGSYAIWGSCLLLLASWLMLLPRQKKAE